MGYSTEVVSPFNGTIETIFYQQGDYVDAGEAIIKMLVDGFHMDILSPSKGKIEWIDVNIGEKVMSGMVIALINE